jgi:hypothetical protein
MDIFESLENLNVSEECFDEIMGIVEDTFEDMLRKKRELEDERRADRRAIAKERAQIEAKGKYEDRDKDRVDE